MLKRMFALSNQGLRDLNKGIAATTLSNLCLIAPVSLLVMVIWELLNVISGQESSMRDHAALFICGTVVMFIIVFLTQWLQYNKTYTVAYKESANRRIVLAEKLRKLPLSFFGQRDLSDLTTTIMGDCTALERVFSNAIPQLFGTIFMFIITAIGLLVLDWRMGLCIVVPVPVAALVVFAAKKAQSNAESANMDAKRAAYDGVQEYLDTIQELKSCSREEEYLEGLEKKLDYVVKCSFRNEIAPGAATTTAQFILRFGLVAVMLVGGILVTTGSLSIPMFILFLLFAGRIYDPFTSCFMLMAEVFSALVSVKRMKQIDATPEQTGTNVCNNKGYDIEFKNVVFSYNEEPVLKGVSFVAKQGEVTALVGPSGSGKSTASKLAARFWDADSGTITLGGVDVKTVEPETLFKNYAIVFQDVMLFDETVMENIRLGRGDATDEEVMAAARAAQCEEFIQRLPQGYQTNIGENGSALSGGERQRISIARALLKNAPIAGICSHTAAFNTMHRIKVRVLEHMSKFNLGFFQEHAPGQIKTTLFDDVDRIETFLAHSTLELAQAIVVPLMMFIFMLRLNWIMALIMLVPMILGIAIPMALMGRYPDLTDEFAGDTEKLNASANEFITAMPVIKMYHLTAEKFEQYRNSLKIYTDCWIKMCESSCNPLSIALVVLDSAILFTLPVGGWLYLRDSLSAASYLLFILLTMCFFTSFLNMVTIAMQSMELGSGLDNVKKIMDMETMKSGQQTLSKTGCYGIDFDNVTFNYTQGGKDALSDVDIHLEPGSLNAFVGPSGAGKTTAVQLLGRYWDVSSGTIKIGGVPVTELQTENLSDLTAFVFQDVFLLEDTLLENIRMGTDATEEQVRQAAKAAQIDDFIMSLPKGYATRIGDEGVKLSGGQQQRISIARAILKDAPIVVFDEATSYSDIENEHKIQLALQNLLRGKTTIMIAHRLHTIRNADKIVVFQDGKVVEQGTHDELIASGSTYSHMWDTYTRETIGEE